MTSDAHRAAHGAPRLLYVVSEDWYFLSHRLPMARAARDAGFAVHVACRVDKGADAIARESFQLHPISFARGKLSPFAALRTIFALRRIHRTVAPDIVHHVSLQPAVLGSLAAVGRRPIRVNALTGLGFIFTSRSAAARRLQLILGPFLRFLFDREGAVALVQNPDDVAALLAFGITRQRISVIPGSGVDTERMRPTEPLAWRVTVAFAGRLLADKGIRALVEAHKTLRARGSDIDLLIAGMPDPANPASVTLDEATSWNSEPGIKWLGEVKDISQLWSRSHIAVLPSRREGLPLSLLEAAACGRPMIATNVPGCREIVVPDVTGLLVPLDDVPALAAAIERLAASAELRARYGSAARQMVVERFSATVIGQQIVALYHRLLEGKTQ